jgi:3-oxoacyl-[acyl-carrier protein] reductase
MSGSEARVAIVTGAATGVGAATALRLARSGWSVVVNYSRSVAEAESTVAQCVELGAKAIAVRADVAEDDACKRIVSSALEAFGRIDGLVNNAGTTKFAPMSDLDRQSAQDFLDVYAVNVIGPYQMARAVAPAMRAAGGGSIVNVSSIAGLTGNGSSHAYVASKGALNTMTLALARNLGPEIRVNGVLPGLIQTRWLKQGLGMETYEKLERNVAEASALQKTCTAEDIADAIVWLIEGAHLVTGQLIPVDGGLLVGRQPQVSR